MKRLILVFILLGCGHEEDITPIPEPDSFCVYKRPPVSTDASQVGKPNPWPFIGCVPNPYHSLHSVDRKGYKTFDCKCRDFY